MSAKIFYEDGTSEDLAEEIDAEEMLRALGETDPVYRVTVGLDGRDVSVVFAVLDLKNDRRTNINACEYFVEMSGTYMSFSGPVVFVFPDVF